jgi:hypothetical protein
MLPINGYSITAKVLVSIIVCIALILGTAWLVDDYNDAKYAEKENKELLAVNRLLEVKTKEVLEQQAAISNLQVQLEGQYVRENERVNEVLNLYTGLINDGFRLRDMGKNSGGLSKGGSAQNNSTNASNGGNTAACSDELSAEATRFLLDFATDADKVVNQLIISQRYATELRTLCSATNQGN